MLFYIKQKVIRMDKVTLLNCIYLCSKLTEFNAVKCDIDSLVMNLSEYSELFYYDEDTGEEEMLKRLIETVSTVGVVTKVEGEFIYITL